MVLIVPSSKMPRLVRIDAMSQPCMHSNKHAEICDNSAHDTASGMTKLKYSLSTFLLIHPETTVGQPVCFAIHSEDTAEVGTLILLNYGCIC